MSGASSDVSGASSGGSSSLRRGGKIIGIPKRCWCGTEIVPLMSKSDHNPYRRYFRCAHAAAKKLMNDNHVFKWIDEVLINEVESLQFKIARHEEQLIEMAKTETLLAEKVQMTVEKEIFDQVEQVLIEAKASMKKMMVLGLVGCVVLGVIVGKVV
ncbi:uncharacterized protein At4g04775-like [Brassica napus]|uniref:GRF-type domain-containing protein n=3 Tax=Brassica oleracea var. oleracea TaxID=109376 RepID=A0A0D3EBD4_BRAOL|nr:PREDICTED: uncharacterized protein At4g04775-like [Brassica oleracea var. oleracea]XP_013608198.1 PREDICTED: uncharacterized protein At4g04775-like [Brassica oleracea var. oleracea]XP_013658530.1 uncharacterized protein At4g04775-like [Brassica napus]